MFQIVSIIFYLILVVYAIYSLIALYALLKFGQNKILGIVVSLVYLAFSLSFYFGSMVYINNLK